MLYLLPSCFNKPRVSTEMLIIFLMVQMGRCSDHKKLRDSVDLLNFIQSLAFEEMESIITVI